jgi:hypothetical protein
MRSQRRTRASGAASSGLIGLLLAGCVYYNGMYNANRLAGSARKAEREGRTYEANNLWGQVATKAESVVVRHPSSKYAEEAAVLRGVALARLGQCDQAMTPLTRVSLARINSELTEEALLSSGLCHVRLGNPAAGDAAFTQLIESKDPLRRREARLQHARMLRERGQYQEALHSLQGVRDPRADPERLLALAGIGRVPEAMSLADSLIARGDTTTPWDSLLTALGRQNPAAASTLVDRLDRLPKQPPEIQARRLLEDGIRLSSADSVRSLERFRQATHVGGAGDAAGKASLQLIRADLRRVDQAQDLSRIRAALPALGKQYPSAAAEASQLGFILDKVFRTVTSVSSDSAQGDLRLFLAAEAARDSIGAPRLAASIWQRIVDQWPASPYAPKAILAAEQVDSTRADTARALLESRYSDSPYLAAIRGEADSAYKHLEDSLGSYAAALAVAESPARGRRPPSALDEPKPGRRVRPNRTTRVVEP